MPLNTEQRKAIVTETVDWVGTPYVGWSCVKGAGVDCGQLIYGVYRNCGLIPVIGDLPKDYPLHIGQHRASNEYVDLVLHYFDPITEAEVQPGDIVVWKLIGSKSYCHAGIATAWPDFIHAYGKKVSASSARNRMIFRKSEKLFFTLRDIGVN